MLSTELLKPGYCLLNTLLVRLAVFQQGEELLLQQWNIDLVRCLDELSKANFFHQRAVLR